MTILNFGICLLPISYYLIKYWSPYLSIWILTPVAKKVYDFFQKQVAIVKEYIDEMFSKEVICSSKLLYTALVLIVKKLKESFWLCVNYCALNALIIKNWNTLFLIWEMFAYLHFAKIYSKFNIIAIFNKIYIWKRNKEKTMFHTWYSLFEYVVMRFNFVGLLPCPCT